MTISFPGVLRTLGHLDCSPDIRPRADPREDTFLFGKATRHDEGVLVADLNAFGDLKVAVPPFRWRLLGTKPAPVPWILCGPGLSGWPARVCEITGESLGSTAIAWNEGFRGLITSTHPVMVPPVPTAETRISTLPSVSSQISSAVVLRWISGFDGVVELLRHPGIRRLFDDLLRSGNRPFIPSAPGVSTSLAPSIANNVRRSRLMVSGMVRISL